MLEKWDLFLVVNILGLLVTSTQVSDPWPMGSLVLFDDTIYLRTLVKSA